MGPIGSWRQIAFFIGVSNPHPSPLRPSSARPTKGCLWGRRPYMIPVDAGPPSWHAGTNVIVSMVQYYVVKRWRNGATMRSMVRRSGWPRLVGFCQLANCAATRSFLPGHSHLSSDAKFDEHHRERRGFREIRTKISKAVLDVACQPSSKAPVLRIPRQRP